MSSGTVLSLKDRAQKVEDKLVEIDDRLAAFCAPGMTPAQVRHSVMMSIAGNPKLLDAKWESIVLSAVVITQWGLDIGRTAYIIPYKGVATPVADYKGYIELMMATRLVKHVNAKAVREADFFEYEEGDVPRIVHRPHWRDKTSPIIGAYCSIPTVAGGTVQVVMNVQEIEAVRSKSHQWSSGPLPEWYACKTPLRRAVKFAPSSPRLALLARMDYDDKPSEETLDRLSTGDVQQLTAGAPVYEPARPAPAIAQPANGYGDGDAEDIGGLL